MMPLDEKKHTAYRKLLSKSSKGLWHRPGYRDKVSKAMSLAHIGTTKDAITRQKISDAQIGVPKPTSGVRGSRHHNWNPNKSEFKDYRRLVQRETERIYRAHKHSINPQNHRRTKCGVEGGYQLDHKVSVKEGFDKKLPVYKVAHINNLQMLSWKENRNKGV